MILIFYYSIITIITIFYFKYIYLSESNKDILKKIVTKIFTYSIDTTYRIYLFFIFLKFFLIEKQTHINILF